jgi:hypothetical protein
MTPQGFEPWFAGPKPAVLFGLYSHPSYTTGPDKVKLKGGMDKVIYKANEKISHRNPNNIQAILRGHNNAKELCFKKVLSLYPKDNVYILMLLN